MLPKFSGDENQDASEHNIKGVSNKFIRLNLFPFYLTDDARAWFKTLPVKSITSWTQLSNLKVFPIFPSGVRYMLGKMRDKSTFSIVLQNFLEEKSTLNLACKSDAVFPKLV
ncbi:unnamed protein product [Malus baccata var. baccata]